MPEAIHPFLERIKQETQAEHDAIEQNPLTSSIVENTITLEQYKHLLQRFLGFMEPCVHLIQENTKNPLIKLLAASHSRVGNLKLDLQAMDALVLDLPACRDLPPLQRDADHWGFIYVVGGSTLGGQILYKTLQKNLKLDKDSGAHFFYGFGPKQTAAQWRVLKEKLVEYVEEYPGEEDGIIQNARLTFKKLDAWLRKGKQENL